MEKSQGTGIERQEIERSPEYNDSEGCMEKSQGTGIERVFLCRSQRHVET